MSSISIQSGLVSTHGSLPTTPVTPSKGSKEQLYHWSKDEIVQRVLELEEELVEFQESSKELEKALEDELQALETANQNLQKQDQIKARTINELNDKIKALKTELNELHDQYNEAKVASDKEIRELKQKLVDVEITNDNMESNDRLTSNKLENLNQFNMELLEKIAILENDLHLEKKANVEKSLHIINHENTINDLKNKVVLLKQKQQPSQKTLSQIVKGNRASRLLEEDHDISEVDVLYLSMKDVLEAGPPASPHLNNMKKSDSLQKLHDMQMKSEDLSFKLKNLRRESLYLKSPPLKSPSTTQLSNHLHTAKSRHEKTKPVRDREEVQDISKLEKSRTSKNLTEMLYKESGKLDTITASPTTSKLSKTSSISTFKGTDGAERDTEQTERDLKKKKKRNHPLSSWFRT